MDELLEGYRRFRRNEWPVYQRDFAALARHGQAPHALIIACSDSRVTPELIFSAIPGDLFVVRNIANLVPPYAPDAANHGTSAALEFAVRVLGVQRIVVVGHSGCGGVAALMRGAPAEAQDFIGNWMRIAEPARLRAEAVFPDDIEAACNRCEIENIRVSLENLRGFPWIEAARLAGNLKIMGMYFDVGAGRLYRVEDEGLVSLDETTDEPALR